MKYVRQIKEKFSHVKEVPAIDVEDEDSTLFSKCPAIGKLAILFLIIFMMAGAGGFFFNKMEYAGEEKRMQKFIAINQTLYETVIYNDNSTYALENENIMLRWKAIRGAYHEMGDANATGNIWQFRFAVFFSITTFSTVGFGFQAPTTTAGQFFTFLYGLPAMMTYFYLSECVGVIFLRNTDHLLLEYVFRGNETYWKKYKIYTYACLFFSAFLIVSAIIKARTTDVGFGTGIETYFDAMYFLWIATSTIGFGDCIMSLDMITLPCYMVWMSTMLGIIFQILHHLNEKAQEIVGPLALDHKDSSRSVSRSTSASRPTSKSLFKKNAEVVLKTQHMVNVWKKSIKPKPNLNETDI